MYSYVLYYNIEKSGFNEVSAYLLFVDFDNARRVLRSYLYTVHTFVAKTDKGAGRVEKKAAAPVSNRPSRGSRSEPSQAPVTSKPKDPLKVVGSKQNIKLTLLNKVKLKTFDEL